MSDVTNLIYNGDFSKGTDSWSGSGVTVSNGVLTVTGDLIQSGGYHIPVSSNRRYRISFDIKFNTVSGTSSFYIALRPYDNKKASIGIASTNKPYGAKTNTTLAAELKPGDTTVTLTSSANWPTNRTYQRVGICENKAWGYGRAIATYSYSSISGNVITLKSAYSGTVTYPAGTKVAEFEDGSTYYYPIYFSGSNRTTDWKTWSAEFNGGNNMRYSCQYFIFSTLGYSHNYSLRNLRIECISDYQECHKRDYEISPQFYKTGIIQAPFFNEVGMDIRYVRDTTNGSTANANSHWCEFQVFNDVGENIAWGRDVKIDSTNYSNSVITDGIVNSAYIGTSSGSHSLIFDIGFVEHVTKIKIWHYYPDGRTYHSNVTEVSVDGTNWFTVYQGEKPETSAGNEIILSPAYMSIYKSGDIWANEFIEY